MKTSEKYQTAANNAIAAQQLQQTLVQAAKRVPAATLRLRLIDLGFDLARIDAAKKP